MGNFISEKQQSKSSSGFSEDKYPSCALLKLHFLETESQNSVKDIQEFPLQLLLTIRFGKQCQEIYFKGVKVGSIWFGMKRAWLLIELTSGKMPIETQHIFNPLPTQDILSIDNTSESETTAGFRAINAELLNLGAKKKMSLKESVTHAVCTISPGGTEERPDWRFEKLSTNDFLNGQLTRQPLGSILSSTRPFKVIGELVIRGQHDIAILEGEGLLPKNLGRNRLAIIEREIFLRFLKDKVFPYISRMEITHG